MGSSTTSYPAALDALANPYDAGQVAVVNDAIEAIQTKLGVTGDGYTPNRKLIRANATRTFTSDTELQAIFTDPAAGALSVGVGTYLFEGLIKANTLHADSGNALLDILGAGTATTGAWLWHATGIDATDPLAAAAQTGSFAVSKASAASVVSAGTGTGLAISVRGTFEVSVAGTVIPSLDQVTAAAMVIEVGSYLVFERFSADVATVSVGPWA